MPFVTPPVEMSAAGGAAPMLKSQGEDGSGLWNVRVALHAPDLAAGSQLQRFDLAVGYTVDSRRLFEGSYARGPYAQFGCFPWVRALSPEVGARFGPFVTADWLWAGSAAESRSARGWGMSTGLAVEVNGFAKGCTSDRGFAACGYGLMGMRGFVAAEVRALDSQRYSAGLVGFSWRLPASVGIVSTARSR